MHPEPLLRLSRRVRIVLRMAAKSRCPASKLNWIEPFIGTSTKDGLTKVKFNPWTLSASGTTCKVRMYPD